MTTRVKDSSDSSSSDAPLAARVHALIAQWREKAKENRSVVQDTRMWRGIAYGQECCATALEVALAAQSEEDEEPDYPIGEPWTEAQLADMRAMALKADLRSARELLERNGFRVEAALAAALAPNSEKAE